MQPGSSGRTVHSGVRLKIVYRRISDLILNPRNPRGHNDKQIRQLARSINKFGFNGAVLIDSKLNVIAGHARIRPLIGQSKMRPRLSRAARGYLTAE
jgi:hypothetical protein